ncbi:MAG: hypothetical protein GX589_09330, partial [Deltaproteobacteria bacterium]|nr:hypothetical protein [Deltaproteobacteria bacterium]
MLAEPLSKLFNPGGAFLVCGSLFLLFVGFSTQKSTWEVVKALAAALGRVFEFCLLTVPMALLWFVRVGTSQVLKTVRWLAGVVLPKRFGEDFGSTSQEESSPSMPKPRLRKNEIAELASQKESLDDIERRVVVMRRERPSKQTKRAAEKSSRKGCRQGSDAPRQCQDPLKAYVPFDISMLSKGESASGSEADEELVGKSKLIEDKLRDFGIDGRVTEVHPGPVITLFEFEPAPGVKVGRIAALQDDLSMSLKASSIRIIAPIPRKGTVGIEVPNRSRELVRLRDVLESEVSVQSESILSVPIGKDTYGEAVTIDVSVMPHLLMAGATGTGKSVSINALLLSLLYRASPSELGLILIDPKILELSVYEGIPHLMVPVVTSPKQARAVLEWAVKEMNRRYRLMQKFGVRSLDGYNRIARGEVEQELREEIYKDNVVMLREEHLLEEGEVKSVNGDDSEPQPWSESVKPIPKIVIVIDELADLMLSVGREIEELITRLAQKARAAGIHLIVATQRPSVDVITGLIKANFPARISFRVASRIDSRTILDSMGADKLLGRGDMLLRLPGSEHVKRVHGAYVS